MCSAFFTFFYLFFFFFFFQAEDGIRDVERSRGLGDVYKRQIRNEGRLKVSNFQSQLYGLEVEKACRKLDNIDTEEHTERKKRDWDNREGRQSYFEKLYQSTFAVLAGIAAQALSIDLHHNPDTFCSGKQGLSSLLEPESQVRLLEPGPVQVPDYFEALLEMTQVEHRKYQFVFAFSKENLSFFPFFLICFNGVFSITQIESFLLRTFLESEFLSLEKPSDNLGSSSGKLPSKEINSFTRFLTHLLQ
eukprot:TRINITY_DN12733_c0_g1_i1.p2 TRINITY_DN12733_c0_g1~~TRINITY_DN12733_c0_g1_i1.p2  ORF type:complete len:247 (+),score=34.11 TRINITY_DN12733_c0_g1_i1:50-790(+)